MHPRTLCARALLFSTEAHCCFWVPTATSTIMHNIFPQSVAPRQLQLFYAYTCSIDLLFYLFYFVLFPNVCSTVSGAWSATQLTVNYHRKYRPPPFDTVDCTPSRKFSAFQASAFY
ncbi:hypothetical protein TRVL_04562 [Trypanosoma vivax]|nr:hypothetical protein TRVL_04562 [Trypanosoma vivax]